MRLALTKYKILVQRHKNKIFAYALYMLKNRMDAEDATQEVLIRLWNNLNVFKVRSAKSYIMKITHNVCLDTIRKNKTQDFRTVIIDDDIQESYEAKDNGDTANNVHYKIMSDEIKIKIQNLPENLRAPFVLYEIHGMKYREISKALNIPLNNVKVSILRARKKLQEKLKYYEKEAV